MKNHRDRCRFPDASRRGRALALALLASAFGLAIGCSSIDSRVGELERELDEERSLSEDLQQHLIDFQQCFDGDQGDATCHEELRARVRREAGTKCEDYKAEISAWSGKCVVDCDRPARLREANTEAAEECAAWCAEKDCPGPRYTPSQACAAGGCYAGSFRCIPQCPLRDYCSSLDVNRVWNCVCVDL